MIQEEVSRRWTYLGVAIGAEAGKLLVAFDAAAIILLGTVAVVFGILATCEFIIRWTARRNEP
jgi:hypothetical protein